MRLTQSTYFIRILLYAALFVGINLLAYQAFFRLDFTADQRYTLSETTRAILRDLDQPVTVTAYFSDNLPPQLAAIGQDLRDLLSEYQSFSDNNLVYEFVDPGEDEEKQAEALQAGVATLDIQSREKDQIQVLQGYMGAVIKVGNQEEVIPRFPGVSGMEYLLSAGIRKLTQTDKARVGFVQGHGEPGLNQLAQARQELEALFEVDTVSFSEDPGRWASFKTLVLLAPSQPLPPEHLAQLDQFMQGGGRLFLGLNAVGGDLQAQAPWQALNTGLTDWLSAKGILVEQAFLIDEECATLTMQRPVRQGPFIINQQIPVPFYYFPFIRDFAEHPVTDGLEQVLLQFASPITVLSPDSSLQVQTLAYSSASSGKEAPPAFFNPERAWTPGDFANGRQAVAVSLEGPVAGGSDTKMVVVSDGDFPLNPDNQPTLPENVYLLANAIDWLTDDTGLIGLRTKGVAARPLEKLTGEDENGLRQTFKVANFLFPILIVLLFGIIRAQRRRRRQLVWQAQDFR
ncbi:MAG: hypothetical protein D6722_06520 [Bacteroidetes bacterium]|nr:MAG: hypothetical protein D6722_06520 [Bacteroidota bacterium]